MWQAYSILDPCDVVTGHACTHGTAGMTVLSHVVFVLPHVMLHGRSNIAASGSPTWKLV